MMARAKLQQVSLTWFYTVKNSIQIESIHVFQGLRHSGLFPRPLIFCRSNLGLLPPQVALTDQSEALNVDSRHWSCLWILHFCRLGFKMCTVPFLWIIFISWTNKQRRRFISHLNRRLTSWAKDRSKKGTERRLPSHFRDLRDHKVFTSDPVCACTCVWWESRALDISDSFLLLLNEGVICIYN